MRLPIIKGVIRRRILVNYRVDPGVIQSQLPTRFKPKLHGGQAVAGICLIRLEHIRPRMLPEMLGVSSENAAHRIAVLWNDDDGSPQEGVFIPRRDTNSQLNYLLGGKVFPGEHHKSVFDITYGENEIALSMKSCDGSVAIEVAGRISEVMPPASIFKSIADASSFFESGALGYSATSDANRLDGLILKTTQWKVEPLEVDKVYSSYFADEQKFPKGSVQFDHALMMRNIEHEWHSASDLYVG